MKLWELHKTMREQFPTSPHHLFENKKNYYAQIKKTVDEMYDAEFDVAQASKNIESALSPMGMNYHFFNYLAPLYGTLEKALRTFEKALKKTTPELKAYYKELQLPLSSAIFSTMHLEMDSLLNTVEHEHMLVVRRNPHWVTWDACVIFEDQVNARFKEACKA